MGMVIYNETNAFLKTWVRLGVLSGDFCLRLVFVRFQFDFVGRASLITCSFVRGSDLADRCSRSSMAHSFLDSETRPSPIHLTVLCFS